MASVRWTKHLTDYREEQEFQRKITNSKKVLETLHALIEEDYAVSERIVHDREGFGTSAWSEKVAFELGVQKALKDVLKLIKVD